MAFAETPENWLLLFGPNGCGKTHLAAAIANRCRMRGERPVFFVVADLLDYLRHLMDQTSGPSFLDGFNQLRNAPAADPGRHRRAVRRRLGARPAVPADQPPLRRAPAHRVHGQHSALERLVEERVLARLNDPGICVEVPITAPAYRVDMSARPSAYGHAQPQTPARREPRPQADKRRYGGGRWIVRLF